MNWRSLLVSVILSVFSTAVMSYVSLATPIGPWIAPTLVLGLMVFMRGRARGATVDSKERLALVVSAGSIGGIVATAFGFSWPTIYFLNPPLFDSWLAAPEFFAMLMGALTLAAGGLGIWIADWAEPRLVTQQKLAFPTGQLVHRMISAPPESQQEKQLFAGFAGTSLFCMLQDGVGAISGVIPKSLTLVPAGLLAGVRVPVVMFDFWPMLWAIGFVAGHLIAVPLGIGALMRVLIVEPLNTAWFDYVRSIDFVLAFGSGMVLVSALMGMMSLPRVLGKAVRLLSNGKSASQEGPQNVRRFFGTASVVELAFTLLLIFVALYLFEFPISCQLYLVIFTFICTYQMASIAGEIGLAQLGRFATFVMVPALFLFSLTPVQLAVIASFVEVCGGVAVDVLFGRKVAQLMSISSQRMKKFQYLGLLFSALAVGPVFWILINKFGLGSVELFAQKAQARALLIQSTSFDPYVLVLGMVFGFLLKRLRVNPMMVLGGLLMPLNVTIGLVTGGMLARVVRKPAEWEPFWSGVFAANSIWMVVRAFF